MSDLSVLVGKRLLVGITYLDAAGEVEDQLEFAGIVTAIEPLVAIERGDGSEPFTLPPEPQAYDEAAAGDYTLRTTGEVVSDPDFVTTWTVNAAG